MKGQTLIEALLALSIVGIILSGITIAVSSSLNNAQFSKNQNLATAYAQEGLEVVRQIRNSDYDAFRTRSGYYCISKVATDFEADCSSPNIDGVFIRRVQILQNVPAPDCGPSAAKAIVSVSWVDGKCPSGTFCHKSQLISCMSTINPVQPL